MLERDLRRIASSKDCSTDFEEAVTLQKPWHNKEQVTYRGGCTRFKAVFSLSTLKLTSRSTIFSSALVLQSAETAARREVAPVVEI